MRDMTSVYLKMETLDLNKLRSRKFVRLHELDGQRLTYGSAREIVKLSKQIVWIDAVLASRKLQTKLPL